VLDRDRGLRRIVTPRIKEVAAAAGVSVATVSRALRGLPAVNEATRELVRATAEQLGYVPSAAAAAVATGQTKAVNVVVPAVSTWFFASVLEGVDSQLRAAGYDMALFDLGYTGTERERVFHRSIAYLTVLSAAIVVDVFLPR
jgi:DNA-binding LacI/PurR family transcriptional regulator